MSNQPNLTITDAAALKVHSIIQAEDVTGLKLRTYITGGGCQGFQYGFALEETEKNNDLVFQKTLKDTQTITIIIDPISMQYLDHSTIDYVEDTQGERFIIRNPNAKTSCGCNRSFST
ncbi:MAG: iron-sulfur cluster insertion protein ErpA [Pseudomonadota bacterium]|nr:iron-sulfur cluster insertion protein ErpA [Pseudomonadota bacterium]